MKRIAWGITGAGHWLNDCVDLLTQLDALDIFLSSAAEEVVQMYGEETRLKSNGARIYLEKRAQVSAPVVARFSRGVYSLLLIAPATANTVAKCAYGIADTLITNLFAQAGKSLVPILVLPTDVAPEIDSPGPNGGLVKVYPREIDLENVERLKGFRGVTVAADVKDLQVCLAPYRWAWEREEKRD